MIYIEENCKICGKPIDSYEYWVTTDYEDYFCSEECYKEVFDEDLNTDFIHVLTCPGYADCERLNNIRDICRHEHVIAHSGGLFGDFDFEITPRWCNPTELSIVRTTSRLYNFILESEERSDKLNNEMLKLTRINVILAGIMIIFSIVNLIIIIFQTMPH